jgi:hypothetical protein
MARLNSLVYQSGSIFVAMQQNHPVKYIHTLFIALGLLLSFANCRKANTPNKTFADSLRAMSGTYSVAGRLEGTYDAGTDTTGGYHFISKYVSDTVETTMTIIFIDADSALVNFDMAPVKQLAYSSLLSTNTVYYRRQTDALNKRVKFEWGPGSFIFDYSLGRVTYSRYQGGIHESIRVSLASIP